MAGNKKDVAALAKNYAKALFSLAEKSQQLDKVQKDLLAIEQLLKISPEFASVANNPVIRRSVSVRLADIMLKQFQCVELTQKFIKVTAHNRRLFLLEAIIEAFWELLSVSKGEVKARVVSAAALPEAQLNTIKAALEKIWNKKVVIQPQVKPEILGGVIVQVGSVMIDLSVADKLNRIENIAKQTLHSA